MQRIQNLAKAKVQPIILFLSLMGPALFAQVPGYDLVWSPTYSHRDVQTDEIIDMDEAFYYTFGLRNALFRGGEFLLAKYDRASSTQVWQVETPAIKVNAKRTHVVAVNVVDGQFFVFLEAFDRGDREKTLLLQRYNREGDPMPMVTVESIDVKSRYTGSFTVRFSQDKERFAIISSPQTRLRDDEKFYATVYDSDSIQIHWSSEFNLDVRDDLFNLKEANLTNDGQLYVLGQYTVLGQLASRLFVDRKMQVKHLIYRLDGESYLQLDLGLQGIYVSDVGMQVDFSSQTVAISGLYSDRNMDWGTTKGLFYIQLDQKTSETKSRVIHPFSDDFKSAAIRLGRFQRRGEVQMDFVFRDFLRRADGGAFVIAENYETYTTTTTTNGTTKTTNHYHYDELLTISVSPEGEIEWVGMIPKMQRTTNDGGFHSGYLPIVDGNSLHVMFNDHPRNAKRFAERKSRNTNNVRRSNLVMVSISPEAQMDYVVMHKNGKERLGPILRLSVASEHVQGDAVILSRTRSKIRMASLIQIR